MIGKIRVFLCRSRTRDLPITSSDALPLSYRGWSEKSECSFAGVELTTLRLLVRMLYHWAIGDRLQNNRRLLPFSEGAKRRKRDSRVLSARASHSPSPFLHSLQTFSTNIYRVACVRKKYVRLFCSLYRGWSEKSKSSFVGVRRTYDLQRINHRC